MADEVGRWFDQYMPEDKQYQALDLLIEIGYVHICAGEYHPTSAGYGLCVAISNGVVDAGLVSEHPQTHTEILDGTLEYLKQSVESDDDVEPFWHTLILVGLWITDVAAHRYDREKIHARLAG